MPRRHREATTHEMSPDLSGSMSRPAPDRFVRSFDDSKWIARAAAPKRAPACQARLLIESDAEELRADADVENRPMLAAFRRAGFAEFATRRSLRDRPEAPERPPRTRDASLRRMIAFLRGRRAFGRVAARPGPGPSARASFAGECEALAPQQAVSLVPEVLPLEAARQERRGRSRWSGPRDVRPHGTSRRGSAPRPPGTHRGSRQDPGARARRAAPDPGWSRARTGRACRPSSNR
jgi:hypothetical protein